MVQKALDTGTDQIQVWPFTAERLGARVEGRPELATSTDVIELARTSLDRIKTTRRIRVIARVLRQNCGDVDFLAAIAKSLVVIRRSQTATQLDYMYSYYASVKEVLEQLIKSVPGLDSRGLV